MELFIKIRDGKPVDHPIFGDNFRQAFPNIDTEHLPPEFAKFVRIEPPEIGNFEVSDGVTYEWLNGVVTDVYHIRPMTDEEHAIKQAEIDAVNSAMEKFKTDNPDMFPAKDLTADGAPPNVIG